MSAAEVGPAAYCAAQVRRHDPDRYLASLFAPARARPALLALYAFDHEIGKVRHVVSQPMAGLIRLQWWRDALDGIEAGRPLAHPVVEALHQALGDGCLSRAPLDAAIDARGVELEGDPLPTRATVEVRLEAASVGITRAALEALGAAGAAELQAGRGVALARGGLSLLLAAATDLRQERLLLPTTAFAADGLSQAQITAGAGQASLPAVVADLAGHAQAHLHTARQTRVARAALPALLPAVLVDDHLRRLRRGATAPAQPTIGAALAPLRLILRHRLGRF